MLFTIQAFVEDYIGRRNFRDTDGYAVEVANLYYHKRQSLADTDLLRRMKRIRTVFFAANDVPSRAEFETALLQRLDKRYKKKLTSDPDSSFPGGLHREKTQFQKQHRKTLLSLLESFKHATESRAIDSFWLSRAQGNLRKRPERIARGLFALFATSLLDKQGHVLQEMASGIGFVDIAIILSSRVLHLIELKVLTKNLVGPSQLEQYMKNENRSTGYLVVFDALPANKKHPLPSRICTPTGTIKVLEVDINPVAPSRQRKMQP